MGEIKVILGQGLAYAWSEETPYLVGLAIAAALLLFQFRPLDRRTLGNTLMLFAASLGGLVVSGIVYAMNFPATAGVLHELFTVTGGIALIRLLGLLLFRVLLPLVHAGAPRIIEDILVMAAYVVWCMFRLRHAGMNLSELVTA